VSHIDVAASSLRLEAEIGFSAGVTVSFVSRQTNTPTAQCEINKPAHYKS